MTTNNYFERMVPGSSEPYRDFARNVRESKANAVALIQMAAIMQEDRHMIDLINQFSAQELAYISMVMACLLHGVRESTKESIAWDDMLIAFMTHDTGEEGP